MSNAHQRPMSFFPVNTYAELDRYVRAFADGMLTLLILLGTAGLQKSRIVRETLAPKACWFEGNATAFGMYRQLYRHRDQPVVIDDVDAIYTDRAAIRLLKSLCQTEARKRISWHSGSPTLDRENIPQEFTTTSRVLLIANEWRSLNAHVTALEDRGQVVVFQPTPLEVHVRAANWFWDQVVFDFIGQHLHLISEPSMRDYFKAWELKEASLDWKAPLFQRWGVAAAKLLVARLKADPSFPSEEARVKAFRSAGGGSRATYFNHAKALRPPSSVPKITLANRPPTTEPDPAGIEELLRRRHGGLGTG